MVRAGLKTTRKEGRLAYTFPLGLDGKDAQLATLAPVVLGVGSAIAIPAFLRAVKRSKTSEADYVMRKLADGAKAYFTGEQNYSAPGGRHPWHVAPSSSSPPGMPVPWGEYVFPGGESFSFASSTEVPKGGAKVIPSPVVSRGNQDFLDATLAALGVSFDDPLYFKYTYETQPGFGEGAVVIIRAEADFKPDTPEVHTMEQRIFIDSQYQEVVISPPFVMNEFE